jgi:hypothetical protein
MGVLWEVAFHPSDLALMVAMYVVRASRTTIGFHRSARISTTTGSSARSTGRTALSERYQPVVPGPPLNGPTISLVIQPP